MSDLKARAEAFLAASDQAAQVYGPMGMKFGYQAANDAPDLVRELLSALQDAEAVSLGAMERYLAADKKAQAAEAEVERLRGVIQRAQYAYYRPGVTPEAIQDILQEANHD